jgi:hypothetical protein
LFSKRFLLARDIAGSGACRVRRLWRSRSSAISSIISDSMYWLGFATLAAVPSSTNPPMSLRSSHSRWNMRLPRYASRAQRVSMPFFACQITE